MEDDDEFGDLYTDVLSAFPSSSQPPPPPSIDLNRQSRDVDAPSNTQLTTSDIKSLSIAANDPTTLPNSNSQEELGLPSEPRVSHPADLDLVIGQGQEQEQEQEQERHELKKDGAELDTKKSNFGIVDELDGADMDNLGSEPVIPGLESAPSATQANQDGSANAAAAAGEGDDWDSDSDSEDDLQIVLNDTNNHGHGHMGMDANGIMDDDDDEDEDGEPLVIVADDDAAAPSHQPAEEQDWGEDAAASTADGKEVGDAAKPNGGLTTTPKLGYNNFGYHPFHSQFKYVRPGAGPLPGGPPAGSGGAVGQVRPSVNMGAMAGRGRGDWRPGGLKGLAMQKGFHSGFWGGNALGRGLEFTLPSHKTIFDVDIDSFEEKPWKYPGVDLSDFFNFSLNEDSWKEYCKQLEQLRLESTMQSKIRVYESGRAEQEYDDMPPELAAAAGIHDSSVENVDITKADGGVGDLTKGSVRVRPPLPTGRAIQVETGYGERLPSVDTRPPRLRDSDAVIEIVLQGSIDDESADKGATEGTYNDSAGEDGKVDVVDDDGPQDGDAYINGYPQGYRGISDDGTKKESPSSSSPHDAMQDEERDKSSPQRTSSGYQSGSRGHAPTEIDGSPDEERWTKGKSRERSPHMSSSESAPDRRSLHYQRDDSIESLEGKRSPISSSPIEDTQEPSSERKVAPENEIATDKKPEISKDVNAAVSANTSKDRHGLHPIKHQKLSSRVEPSMNKEVDEVDDFKASRSSDNSKVTVSSRDHQKWHEGVEEEVVQNGRSAYTGDLKRHRGEVGYDSRRKDCDGRTEVERNYMLAKGKEDFYSQRDWDPYAAKHSHLKSEGIDRRKERDYPEVSWQRRDEEVHGRRARAEDVRKQDRADEMVPRHRGKAREVDRNDKDESMHSRMLLDNGSWRGYHDKDVGLRYRDKDDNLKNRHEMLDDHYSKRRKDDYVRKDHVDREDVLQTHREGSSRRKRERDDASNPRKRDDPPRVRDNFDDHHSVRLDDEVWVQRERAEPQRERDDWYRSKQSYEENLSRREREDGRSHLRTSRNVEEKTWVGYPRGKEEYKSHDKDTVRHGDQLSRRDRVEDETSLQHRRSDDGYARGSQFNYEGKKSRQERSNARNDRPAHASDNQRVQDKKHKDNVRKARESEGISGPSKRHQGKKGVANEMADMKGMNERAEAKHDILLQNLNGESRDDGSSDEEHRGSKRGRSKLERWTSHKERDYAINSKLSSSLKIKGTSKDKTAVAESSSVIQDESAKVEDLDKKQSLSGAEDGGGSEGKDADAKPLVDGHLDTVEKLKRRSERFKLPLTSEKETTTTKKTESEALPLPQSEVPTNSEVKQERPARKRRWISG